MKKSSNYQPKLMWQYELPHQFKIRHSSPSIFHTGQIVPLANSEAVLVLRGISQHKKNKKISSVAHLSILPLLSVTTFGPLTFFIYFLMLYELPHVHHVGLKPLWSLSNE